MCRVEESISSKDKSVVESINDIFNPTQRLEKQSLSLAEKLTIYLVVMISALVRA